MMRDSCGVDFVWTGTDASVSPACRSFLFKPSIVSVLAVGGALRAMSPPG